MSNKDGEVVSLKGNFEALEEQKSKRGRKPLDGKEKTAQQGIRTKVTAWAKFKKLVKKMEMDALERGEEEPTQGDVFEKAIDLLLEKYK